MGLLSDAETRFEVARAGGGFESSFRRWRRNHPAIALFSDLESVVEFCRSTEDKDLDHRDDLIFSLSREAVGGDERAALLLVWLHLPGLWEKVRKLATALAVMETEDFDAELLAGYAVPNRVHRSLVRQGCSCPCDALQGVEGLATIAKNPE